MRNSQEIGIGILANLSCQTEIGTQILFDQELTTVLVSLMTSDDSQTMIQIVRLLHTLLQSSQVEPHTSLPSFETLMKSMAFILQNSLNGIFLKLFYRVSIMFPVLRF